MLPDEVKTDIVLKQNWLLSLLSLNTTQKHLLPERGHLSWHCGHWISDAGLTILAQHCGAVTPQFFEKNIRVTWCNIVPFPCPTERASHGIFSKDAFAGILTGSCFSSTCVSGEVLLWQGRRHLEMRSQQGESHRLAHDGCLNVFKKKKSHLSPISARPRNRPQLLVGRECRGIGPQSPTGEEQ